MDSFFYPNSIAVVGASKEKGKVGNTIINKLKNYDGKVFYVNQKGYEINKIKCYKSLLEIKDNIELVIIAVKADSVIHVIEECSFKGIKNCIIVSSGFADSNNSNIENELSKLIKKSGIRVLGPNNFGIVNTENDLDCTFSKLFPLKGNVSFASQSGAIWSFIAEYSIKNNLGFSKFVSFGDMIDLDFNDAIRYLSNDNNTDVIVLYIETLKNGRLFMDFVRKCKKPVIVIKGGKTEKGISAVHSHTGSIAGSYEIYKAASKQCGAYFVDTLTEALDLAKLFSFNKKIVKGRETLVITNAGGPGVLLSDLLAENNLLLSETKNLKLTFNWSNNNPIDVLGDANSMKFKEVFLKIKSLKFSNLIVILTPQDMTDDFNIANEIIKIKNCNIICCFLGSESFRHSIQLLEKNKIINFFEIERVAKLLKNLHRL